MLLELGMSTAVLFRELLPLGEFVSFLALARFDGREVLLAEVRRVKHRLWLGYDCFVILRCKTEFSMGVV